VSGQDRKDVRPGARVEIVQKKDQRSGRRTAGVVKEVLTPSAHHPRGIKVRLVNGQIGRVQAILADATPLEMREEPSDDTEENRDGARQEDRAGGA
jgi:uncharacterized repeat protein (TIGR03833 family)